MADDLDSELLECFAEEVQEYLSEWESICLELKSAPSKDLLVSLFRAAHNLKGSSRTLGLDELGAFVHKIEDLIGLLVKNPADTKEEDANILLSAQSVLSDWLDHLIDEPGYKPEWGDLLDRALGRMDRDNLSESTVGVNSGQSEQQEPIVETPEPVQEVHEPVVAEAAPEVPAEPAIDNPNIEVDQDLLAQVKAELAAEGLDVEDEAPAPVEAPQATMSQGTPQRGNVAVAAKEAVPEKKKKNEVLRVKSEKLDRLIQMIGELSLHQAIIYHSYKSNLLDTDSCKNAILFASKITKEVQADSLALRMNDLSLLFQRLTRTASDIARDQGKRIDIQTEGNVLELDKSVIEAITEPLIHIIRNAVDHGIEDADLRKNRGKNEVATIRLIAKNETNGVRLLIKDDGNGINPEKIYAKAVEKGLISAGAKLSRIETLNLIFQSGFSTAAQVTSVSGRGVGMEVVKKAIDELGGSIEIDSEYEKGSTFDILLPTNLSLLDSVIVQVGEDRFVLPLGEISEIVDLKENSIRRGESEDTTVFSLRDELIPIRRLDDFLGTGFKKSRKPPQEKSKDKKDVGDRNVPAIVSTESGQMVAYLVDKVIGQQRVILKDVSGMNSLSESLSGATILGDGKPGFVVSLKAITRELEGNLKQARGAA